MRGVSSFDEPPGSRRPARRAATTGLSRVVGRGVLRARLRDRRRVRASRGLARTATSSCSATARGCSTSRAAALHERRAPERADRAAIVEALERYGFVWEGWATDYRPRREADRRRLARAGRLGRPDPVHVVGLGGGRARAAHREDRHRPTERDLARLRLPRLDARRALADGLLGSRGILAAADSDEVRRPPGIPMQGVHFAPRRTASTARSGTPIRRASRTTTRSPCIAATEHLIGRSAPTRSRPSSRSRSSASACSRRRSTCLSSGS